MQQQAHEATQGHLVVSAPLKPVQAENKGKQSQVSVRLLKRE